MFKHFPLLVSTAEDIQQYMRRRIKPNVEYSDNFPASLLEHCTVNQMSGIQSLLSNPPYCLGNKSDKCTGNTNQLALEWQRGDIEIAEQVTDKSSTDSSWQMVYNLSISIFYLKFMQCENTRISDERMLYILKWVTQCYQKKLKCVSAGDFKKFQ